MVQILPRVPPFRIVPPAACCRDLSPFLIVPPIISPRFPLLRIPVSSCFAFGTLLLCAAETFQKCGKVLHLLSKLSDFTILVAWRSSRNAFCCIGRPQVRSVFLLVFCPPQQKSLPTPLDSVTNFSAGFCFCATRKIQLRRPRREKHGFESTIVAQMAPEGCLFPQRNVQSVQGPPPTCSRTQTEVVEN